MTRNSIVLGACAITLITGCATATHTVLAPRIAPVYRVEQPAGTAAGQYAVGRMELAAGRIEAAIQRFHQSLRLDAGYAEAHNGLGVAYGEQGRFDEAIAAFRSALATGPAHAHVLSNLGYAQYRAGRLDDAWESLTRALELDAYNVRTRENLALLAERRRHATRVAAPAQAASASIRPVTAPVVEIVEREGSAPALVRAVVAAAQSMAAAILEPAAVAPASTVPAQALASEGLEVSNGVGIKRLAARTARRLSRLGIDVASVSDYRPFGLRASEIHYRTGHLAGAVALQQRLPVAATLVGVPALRSGSDVRLVIGRDMLAQAALAWWNQPLPAATVAHADARGGWRRL